MDKKILQVYEDSLEDQPMAHEELKVAYRNLGRALDEYIEEIQKSAFYWGYEVGRKAGE
ncbi:hypothetical protein [Clostridium sp. AN503]|uniref:hypothetical protein n=1 Tax=Clostridium sp. AN503 TaxID=3160598 RepID=UPI00345ACA5D